MPASDSGFNWSQLSAEEVLTLLQRGSAAGRVASGFLDTHQWAPLQAKRQLQIYGGYEEAQYRRITLSTDPPSVTYHVLTGAKLPKGVSRPQQFRHWCYRAGLPPDSLGDIVFGDQVWVIAEEDIEFPEIGLPARRENSWRPPPLPPFRITAASSRADAIVAAAFKVSRGEAQTAIEYGFVFLNFQPLTKRKQQISTGDQLVYRNKGRAQIVGLQLNPRSGRIWVEYCSFPG